MSCILVRVSLPMALPLLLLLKNPAGFSFRVGLREPNRGRRAAVDRPANHTPINHPPQPPRETHRDSRDSDHRAVNRQHIDPLPQPASKSNRGLHDARIVDFVKV